MATASVPILFGSLTIMTATACLTTFALPYQSPWAKAVAAIAFLGALGALIWNLVDPTGFP